MRYMLYILAFFGAFAWWAPVATAGQKSDATTGRVGSRLPIVDNGALECDTNATQEELLVSAREMFVVDNYSLAEMLYQCVLARDPDNLSAILELSVVYEAAGKLQYAVGLLSRAAILRPFDQEIIDRETALADKLAKALEVEIDSLLARGVYETALPKLSALIGERPEDAELYYKKAMCYLELGDAGGALLEIDKAVGIKKDIRYSALRSEALKLNETKDVGALVKEVKRLATSDRATDRHRALALLSQILARDPEHEWARKQFVALNGQNGAADPNARLAERSRAAVYAQTAARNAGAFVAGVSGTIERHIGLLLVLLIALIVFGSPLTLMIIRGFHPRQPLSGRLNEFNIHEILSLIHSQGKSGVLRIHAGPVRGRVYFVDGEICHCASEKLEGRDAVRGLLTRVKDGHFVLTKLPRSFKQTMDVPFSLVLMDIGDRSFLEPRSQEPEPSYGPQKKSKMKSLLENKP